MTELKISIQLAQAVVNYLVTKPYNEVFQLINAFQEATKVSPQVEEKEEDKK